MGFITLSSRSSFQFSCFETRKICCTADASEIPRSFEESVSQATAAVRSSVFGTKKPKIKALKSVRKLWVEIPALDTGNKNTVYSTSQLVNALQSDGRSTATVVCCRQDHYDALKSAFSSNPVYPIQKAFDETLSPRLLIVHPEPSSENEVFGLLDDVWRGEVVLLLNPEFSDEFKEQRSSFLKAFDVVYCFLPLAIKVFIQSRFGRMEQDEFGI